MRVQRKFISVGHGGFSKETFYGIDGGLLFTVVYDCGSKRLLEITNKISENIGVDEIIDILFISHFDSDHINGIEYLLQNYTVRKIMMPMYNDAVLLTEYVASQTVGTAASVTPATRFIGTVLLRQNNQDVNYVYVSNMDRTDKRDDNIICSGLPLNIPNDIDWELIPYNIPFDETEYYSFYDWFVEHYPMCFDNGTPITDIINETLTNPQVFQQVRTKIRNIHNRNKHSMILYSGPSTLNAGTQRYAPCLYMGDFEAALDNTNKIRNLLDVRWPYIHLLQVPHHGSIYNFHEDAGLYNNGICGIVFASENETNYPAETLQHNIREYGGLICKVTYSEYTEQLFKIN